MTKSLKRTAFAAAKALFPVPVLPSLTDNAETKLRHKQTLAIRSALVTNDWPQKAATALAILDKSELPLFNPMTEDAAGERIMYIYQALMEFLLSGLNAADINNLMQEYHASLITNIDNTGKMRYNKHQANFVETVNYVEADLSSLLQAAYLKKEIN